MSWKPVLLIILQMLPALSRCWAAGQAAEQQGSLPLHTQIRTLLLTPLLLGLGGMLYFNV